jgi:NADH-quinone oxidoreductase subunit L
MLLVITGVGFLIHLYSTGYMSHDPDQRRYFTYLNLFVFSMLTLVLGGSFLTLFVGWELVGACSYLLIGFWHKDEANAAAGRKAFVVNRIGDFAFLIGMMLVWTTFGTLSFTEVLPRAAEATGMVALAIPLLLLIGATGKSAQVPLYVWLPDAMAGPTPVSALIHAATMVTAGVYMIARVHPIFENAPSVMAVVAVVGAATALIAALIALVQVDIKRVLAYSTVSQLGYMFLALGAGAFSAAVFHLMTHAFFKGLLFLGAGSVMHAMEHGFEHAGAHPEALDGIPPEQDMRHMGGLLKRAPVTGWTFLIGGLALAGLFPLAGFWSKDEILLETLAHGGAFWTSLYVVGLLTAFLTAFYTGRQLWMVLFGAPRSAGAEQAAESPLNMTIPLIVLAILSIVGGLPVLAALGAPLPAALEPVLGAHHLEGGPSKLVVALVASATALAGLALAWARYGRQAPDTEVMGGAATGAATKALWGKLYVDEAYHTLFVAPFKSLAGILWRIVDDQLVDGAVNGVGRSLVGLGQRSRRWQSGLVRSYGLSILLGAALVAAWLLVAAL